jgi:hypothetical protein
MYDTMTSKLVPFTGYYSMDVAPGAFLSIDTTEERSVSASQPTPSVRETIDVSINVSMVGKSCTSYSFSDGATFDGVTLDIPGRLTLAFSRHYRDGHLASFTGTIGGVSVKGESYFNQVPLSAFTGDYYDVETSRKVLSIRGGSVLFDFSIFADASGELQQVKSYSYLPAMFVLTFIGEPDAEHSKFTLMLGTAGKNGLACSIQGGGTPRLAVSILPFGR